MRRMLGGPTATRVAPFASVVLVIVAAILLSASFGEDAPAVESLDENAGGEPWGLHLSFTEDPATTMTITWFTNGSADPGSLVEYGAAADALTKSTTGTSFPLTLDPEIRVHAATMTDLTPGDTFYYRVTSGGQTSDVHASKTIPDDASFRIALYGDQGLSDAAWGVRDEIMTAQPDLILIAGDLSYAEGDQEEWNEWFQSNERLFATVPMLAAPGNHEGYADEGTIPFQEVLSQPGEELYFSIDIANVHVLVFHSTLSDARSEGVYDDMIEFAEADLEQAAEAKQAGEIDHIFVLQHHPLYSNTASQTRWVDAELATTQEHWFHRYDVAMGLVAHNHNYERSFPMAYTVPTTFETEEYEDEEGWIQIISGGGGRSLYDMKHPDDFLPFSAAHAQQWHFTQMDIAGELVDVTAIQAYTGPGTVLDAFTWTDTGTPTMTQAHVDHAHAHT